MSPDRSYCTFRLDRLLAGLEVGHVQEVLSRRPLTPVPLADRSIRGLVNLRGQIVLAVDLRRFLDLDDPPDDRARMSVVVLTPFGPACLLVDEVLEIVEVRHESFDTPPETLAPRLRSFAHGTYATASGLMLALDAGALVRALEADLSAARAGPAGAGSRPPRAT